MGWRMAGKKKQEEKDNDLEDYGRQIWLAGLGAYTRLGKEGSKLFEALISEGEEAEKLASKASLDGARDKVKKARKKLSDKLSGLEERFDKGKQGAAERMGLASQADLQALAERVDQLTSAVEKLSNTPLPRRRRHRGRAVPRPRQRPGARPRPHRRPTPLPANHPNCKQKRPPDCSGGRLVRRLRAYSITRTTEVSGSRLAPAALSLSRYSCHSDSWSRPNWYR